MIKKPLAFVLLVLVIAVPFVVRLARVRREDRDAVTLLRALDDARRTGRATLLAQALRSGIPANTLICGYLRGADMPLEQLKRCVSPPSDSTSPLWEAAMDHDLPAVETLLAHGADPRFDEGETNDICQLYEGNGPGLRGADTQSPAFIPIMRLLVARGADVNRGWDRAGQGVAGVTAPQTAATALDFAVMNADPKSIAALRAMGARAKSIDYTFLLDLDCPDPKRSDATVRALCQGSASRLPILLDHDPETYVQSALIDHQDCRLAEQLAVAGFAPDADHIHESSIVHALENNAPEIVPTLIQHGANVNARSGYQNETPLEEAAKIGNVRIADLLLAHGARASDSLALLRCVEAPVKGWYMPGISSPCAGDPADWLARAQQGKLSPDQDKLAAYLIGAGADVDTRDDNGLDVLFFAACADDAPLVRLAIAFGARIDSSRQDDRLAMTLWNHRHPSAPLPVRAAASPANRP